MKTRPKKKAAQAKNETPPLLRLAKREKPYVERVHDEIQANLRHLLEGVQASPADAEKCVAALVNAAVNATAILEALYGSGSEIHRDLVRQVALRGDRFVGTYDFRLPSALRDKPRPVETRGDQMRRELTKEWQASAALSATGKTEYDWLRIVMEGFALAVHHPQHARTMEKSATATSTLDWFLESKGRVSVPEAIRRNLLKPENRRKAEVWARALVDWYDSLHPWPFKDKTGDMTWPKSVDEIRDPIHKIAFQRLTSLQKNNPNEKSPLNALRAVVRERFESAFSEVKVERDSDL